MKKIITLFASAFFALAYSSLSAQQYYNPSNTQQYYNPSANSNNSNQMNFNNSSQINWLNNYQDAVRQAQATSRPIVLLFTGGQWCPACVKLEREVLSRPEFAQAVNNRFVFVKAEFSDPSAEAIQRSPFGPLKERYGVKVFPTIVVVNWQGDQLFTVPYQAGGAQAYSQQLNQKLDQALSSYNSYYAQ